jgi:anti-sigma B factor antagonist
MMAGLICDVSVGEGSAVRTATPFDARVSETGRGVLVRVRGPLDLHYAPVFQQQVNSYVATGKLVVVDLRQADYVDSSGIRALLRMQKDLESAKGELRLVVSPASRVERVIKLLQLHTHFHLFPSAAEAWDRQGRSRVA